jgi:hypothetical protein
MDINTKQMSNEEMIEEILIEASAYGLRLEVIEFAKRNMEQDPTMDRVDAHIHAFNDWIK